MNSSFKRTLALVLAALMCVTSLAACAADGGKEAPTVTTASPTPGDTSPTDSSVPAETEEPRITPNLPAADFEGHKFTVLTKGQYDATFSSRDIYAEGITGEVINDAVYQRNKKIEQIYNFEVVEVGSNDPANVAKNSIMAQNDEYDMLCIRLKDHITSLIHSGYLYDLNTIDLLDLDQPYYDQSAKKYLSIAGKQFVITGDLLTMDNDATTCVLFNKTLFQDLLLEQTIGGSLYDMVKAGKWTLDMLEQCAMLATSDLDGNQKMDDQDRWGMANEEFNSFVFYNAAGLTLFEKDPITDLPTATYNTEKSISVLQRIIPLINAEFSKFYTTSYSQVHPFFKEGKILFHPSQLAEVTLYRAMEFDFGIIPQPKYSEDQDRYYSPIEAYGTNSIAIPITASNLDRTATIIEALSCESMYTVTPAYYEVALEGKMLRDVESTEMLEIILSTAMIELGYMWNWGSIYGSICTATNTNNTNLASTFKVLQKMIDRSIESTIKAIEDLS